MLRAALLAGVILSATPALAAPPNIIVIMTDDQDDNLSIMPKVSTRLSQGTRFVNSFVNYPLCSPSRATLLSGQLSHNHRVDESSAPSGMFVGKGLLPMWLQDVGYSTALIGVKSLNQYFEPPTTLGFEHYAVVGDRQASRYYDIDLDVDGVVTPRPGEYSTDVFRREAVRFVRDSGKKPYFLMVAVAAPHAPALPAARHVGACADVPFEPGPAFNEADVSDKPSFMAGLPLHDAVKVAQIEGAFRDRCETLLSVDELAADLIARAGKHTCVFFTSDHGLLAGQHRNTGKLLAAYEESIRAPLVMWGCDAPRGRTIDALVTNADLTATIVDLAGAAPSRKQDGRSLLPLFAKTPPAWRTAIPVSGAWEHLGGGTSTCVRTTSMIYCAHSTGERELYDLDADPFQLENIAAEPASRPIVARLHDLAKSLNSCAGAKCWFTGDPLAKPPR